MMLMSMALVALTVVVPDARSAAEKTATDEFVTYVRKVTGENVEVAVESKAPAGAEVHIGPTAFAKSKVPDLDRFGIEEWTIRSAGGKLVIVGGVPRGTLYGVYHYLEDVLGVRWFSPVAEYVPQGKLILDSLDLRGRPAMPYRTIYCQPGENGKVFLARNRANVAMDARYGYGKVFGGSTDCHSMYPNLGGPDEIRRLFKEHPDWFPLIKGKRYCHVERANSAAQSQLCLTNPELREYWAEKLREWIIKDRESAAKAGVPPPMYYAFDQNDCFDGFCECESCQALRDREGSSAGLMLDFANFLGEKLEMELGPSRISMMALHSSEKPPKFLKARHNVTVRTCDTTSNVVLPWTSEANRKHLENVKAWAEHTDSLTMWDYQINFGAISAVGHPTPTERTFASDLRSLREAHGDGVFFEHEMPVGCDMRDLKVWLEFKLIENPDLDPKVLVRDFTDKYYGPEAGAVIRRYRAKLGAAASEAKAHVSWFPSISAYNFITARNLLEFYALREEALAAVKGEAEKTARVEHAFLSLDRIYLVTSIQKRRYLEINDPASVKLLPDPAAVSARYRRVFEYEMKARGYSESEAGLKRDVTDLLAFVDKARELPVPEIFRDVAKDALFLVPATFAGTWYRGMQFVDDPTSPAKRALTANLALVKANPHEYYPQSAYSWPLNMQLPQTMNGHLRQNLDRFPLPAEQPKGYHWYKAFENVPLKQDSYLHPWAGCRIPLVGAVSDNSELGQLYDVWISLKIEGGDVYTTKLPDWTVIYYIDQVATVRKTKNGEK